MNIYQVTLKRTSYANYEVLAKSKEEAEAKAFKHLERDPEADSSYGEWECESVEQETEQPQ